MRLSTLANGLIFALAHRASGMEVDIDSPESIKKATKLIAKNLMSYYHGHDYGMTPGILPGPPPDGDYYWWQGGALWGTMVDYWYYTGDETYNNITQYSLVFQAGAPQNSYMPANWTSSLGNDDQGFWGLSAMLAAELTFPDPPASDPQWLALAQGVYNTQAAPDRHDDVCGGGLRWQIPFANTGYDYKNAIANGIFFNMGARLARYTGNDSYAQTAAETYNWVEGVGFLSEDYEVFDGAHTGVNCTDIHKAEFSYNAAVYLQGAAFMYNYTNGSDIWRKRVAGLTNHTLEYFFPESTGGAAVEVSCELAEQVQCKTDMLSFKGYLHRWLATATQLAPFVHDTIMTALRTSAAAAAKSCDTAGVCGFRWTTGAYDGMTGAGQQMNALAALSSLLVEQSEVQAPVTNSTGGTSVGNPSAGGDPADVPTEAQPITRADQAGAGILTALMVSGMLATMAWLATDMSESGKWNALP